jgi:hypothetical protein
MVVGILGSFHMTLSLGRAHISREIGLCFASHLLVLALTNLLLSASVPGLSYPGIQRIAALDKGYTRVFAFELSLMQAHSRCMRCAPSNEGK